MARKVYQIQFKSREAVGVFLFELRMWGVRDSRYAVRDDYSVLTKDLNVVDVCTESFAPSAFVITQATACPKDGNS